MMSNKERDERQFLDMSNYEKEIAGLQDRIKHLEHEIANNALAASCFREVFEIEKKRADQLESMYADLYIENQRLKEEAGK